MCSPIRTRSTAPSGHGSEVSASWHAPAASTAATALGKTAKKLSPSPREVTTTPPWSSITLVSSRLCASSAASIASGTVSRSRVKPLNVGQQERHRPGKSVPPGLPAKLSLSSTARS